MSEQIDRYANRMRRVFRHGDMSYHLAKLLEEAGELSAAVTKDKGNDSVADEVADVVLSALLIGAAYAKDSYPDWDAAIDRKLRALEGSEFYQNVRPPEPRIHCEDEED